MTSAGIREAGRGSRATGGVASDWALRCCALPTSALRRGVAASRNGAWWRAAIRPAAPPRPLSAPRRGSQPLSRSAQPAQRAQRAHPQTVRGRDEPERAADEKCRGARKSRGKVSLDDGQPGVVISPSRGPERGRGAGGRGFTPTKGPYETCMPSRPPLRACRLAGFGKEARPRPQGCRALQGAAGRAQSQRSQWPNRPGRGARELELAVADHGHNILGAPGHFSPSP